MKTQKSLCVLATILLIEGLSLAVAAAWSVVMLVVFAPDSYASALMITALLAGGAAWVLAIALGAFRARPWMRAAALTWQILQIAVAIGLFQGTFARPDIAWMLLLPAIAAMVLLFVPSVVRATKRDVAG